jgi:hypothetical protein
MGRSDLAIFGKAKSQSMRLNGMAYRRTAPRKRLAIAAIVDELTRVCINFQEFSSPPKSLSGHLRVNSFFNLPAFGITIVPSHQAKIQGGKLTLILSLRCRFSDERSEGRPLLRDRRNCVFES